MMRTGEYSTAAVIALCCIIQAVVAGDGYREKREKELTAISQQCRESMLSDIQSQISNTKCVSIGVNCMRDKNWKWQVELVCFDDASQSKKVPLSCKSHIQGLSLLYEQKLVALTAAMPVVVTFCPKDGQPRRRTAAQLLNVAKGPMAAAATSLAAHLELRKIADFTSAELNEFVNRRCQKGTTVLAIECKQEFKKNEWSSVKLRCGDKVKYGVDIMAACADSVKIDFHEAVDSILPMLCEIGRDITGKTVEDFKAPLYATAKMEEIRQRLKEIVVDIV